MQAMEQCLLSMQMYWRCLAEVHMDAPDYYTSAVESSIRSDNAFELKRFEKNPWPPGLDVLLQPCFFSDGSEDPHRSTSYYEIF